MQQSSQFIYHSRHAHNTHTLTHTHTHLCCTAYSRAAMGSARGRSKIACRASRSCALGRRASDRGRLARMAHRLPGLHTGNDRMTHILPGWHKDCQDFTQGSPGWHTYCQDYTHIARMAHSLQRSTAQTAAAHCCPH